MKEQWRLSKFNGKKEVEKYHSSSLNGLFGILTVKGVFNVKKK